MALRIRPDGRILCAAIHPEKPGDVYIDDGIHYRLSAEAGALVTEPFEAHLLRGEWWWKNQVPQGVTIDKYYTERSR